MKIKIKVEKEVEVKTIRLELPVRYGEDDIPNNFPLRVGDMWKANIDIDTGKIQNWPKGKAGNLNMKVCDEGNYFLYDKNGDEVGNIKEDYVPNDVVPGEYGDYVILEINEEGIITNWPKTKSLHEFFPDEDED